jgi:hypothetical protein
MDQEQLEHLVLGTASVPARIQENFEDRLELVLYFDFGE